MYAYTYTIQLFCSTGNTESLTTNTLHTQTTHTDAMGTTHMHMLHTCIYVLYTLYTNLLVKVV